MRPVRVVLDTNVVASALLWGGTPERLIQAADEGLEIFTPAYLLARYTQLATLIAPAELSVSQLRDPGPP